MTVAVKQLPGVRHLVPNDLTRAAADQGDFKGETKCSCELRTKLSTKRILVMLANIP